MENDGDCGGEEKVLKRCIKAVSWSSEQNLVMTFARCWNKAISYIKSGWMETIKKGTEIGM